MSKDRIEDIEDSIDTVIQLLTKKRIFTLDEYRECVAMRSGKSTGTQVENPDSERDPETTTKEEEE